MWAFAVRGRRLTAGDMGRPLRDRAVNLVRLGCNKIVTFFFFNLNINQLDALNFIISISCLYMFRAQVLIVRRSKLYYTASGIITPVGGRPVHRLRES